MSVVFRNQRKLKAANALVAGKFINNVNVMLLLLKVSVVRVHTLCHVGLSLCASHIVHKCCVNV